MCVAVVVESCRVVSSRESCGVVAQCGVVWCGVVSLCCAVMLSCVMLSARCIGCVCRLDVGRNVQWDCAVLATRALLRIVKLRGALSSGVDCGLLSVE